MDASTRRDFVKVMAAAGAGAAIAPWLADRLFGGFVSTALEGDAEASLDWHKAPCRFCGTGCGTLVGLKDGRVLSVKGDPQAPVNKGLLCVKGYGLSSVLEGSDRLRTPQIRENGKLRPATWDEALDHIATHWKRYVAEKGPDSVAMFGSGQWTIPEGYAALKLMKGGIQTNNLEPNARFCMASAVAGYMTTYGIDEPSGCYDDFDLADRFVLWGSNMAEMHPMLFNRILQRRGADANVEVISLQTYRHLTDEVADRTLLFKPHSDLLLANAIAYLLVQQGKVDRTFVGRHAVFKRTTHDDADPVQGGASKDDDVDFDTYAAWLEAYAPEKVADRIGIPPRAIQSLADVYGDPDLKVVSLWTMGMNQHTRGTWINNLVHNLHLLTGKIGKPGSTPFSLTGQPSACGTCREVGTFTHRLPSDRVVANPEHRHEIETIWKLPEGTIPGPERSPLKHAMALWEAFAAGQVHSIWVQVTNPFQTMPDLNRYLERIRAHPDRLLIVSDMVPTVTSAEADVVLPSATWIEKEGMFGNSERRTHHFAKLVEAPGEARPDAWQTVEVARRMGHEHLFPKAWDDHLERRLYEEYRECTLGTGHDVATYDELVATRGMRWPVVDGKETRWRFVAGQDPYAKRPQEDGLDFYGRPDHRAVIWARPYEPPAESPDDAYPFWLCTGRVLEHWHTGTMTRRVAALHRAVPKALAYLGKEDAKRLKIHAGDTVRLTSRRGAIDLEAAVAARVQPPPGTVYVPFFDEDLLINELVLGAIDPISKQPDYKKCAVQIEKVGS